MGAEIVVDGIKGERIRSECEIGVVEEWILKLGDGRESIRRFGGEMMVVRRRVRVQGDGGVGKKREGVAMSVRT